MSVFGGLEDNAPDGSIYEPTVSAWNPGEDQHPNWGSTQDETSSGALNASSSNEPISAFGHTTVKDEGAVEARNAFDKIAANREKRRKKRLNITVTRIEPLKNETIIWFDVAASLPRFRATYKDVRRTHHEMRRFANHLINANPECFVPALPSHTNSIRSIGDRLEKVQKSIQKWFDRVTRSPLLTRDEEFLYFVEAITGYVPVVKVNPPATGIARLVVKQKQPPQDDVAELREFRPEAKKLYQFSVDFKLRLEKVSKARKELSQAIKAFSQEVSNASEDDSPHLNAMWNRVSRASMVQADTEARKIEIQESTLGDTLELVSNEAFIIKETLTNRHFLIRDLIKSQTATREKHQRANQLKGSSDISPHKVDDAIVQLEAAAHLEKRITATVRRVSDNLKAEKQLVLARIESDILDSVASYALQFIDQDRRALVAWENTRPEVRAADPNGGLSQLGRDNVASPKRHRYSQSRMKDDWSDRDQRARDIAPGVSNPEAVESLDRKAVVSMLTADLSRKD